MNPKSQRVSRPAALRVAVAIAAALIVWLWTSGFAASVPSEREVDAASSVAGPAPESAGPNGSPPSARRSVSLSSTSELFQIEFLVQDERGEPVEGARVLGLPAASSFATPSETRLLGATDRGGRLVWTTSEVLAGELDFVCQWTGSFHPFQEVSRINEDSGSERFEGDVSVAGTKSRLLQSVTRRPFTLEFQCRTGRGKALPGVRVSVSQRGIPFSRRPIDSIANVCDPVHAVYEAVSDDVGRVTLQVADHGTYCVDFDAQDHIRTSGVDPLFETVHTGGGPYEVVFSPVFVAAWVCPSDESVSHQIFNSDEIWSQDMGRALWRANLTMQSRVSDGVKFALLVGASEDTPPKFRLKVFLKHSGWVERFGNAAPIAKPVEPIVIEAPRGGNQVSSVTVQVVDVLGNPCSGVPVILERESRGSQPRGSHAWLETGVAQDIVPGKYRARIPILFQWTIDGALPVLEAMAGSQHYVEVRLATRMARCNMQARLNGKPLTWAARYHVQIDAGSAGSAILNGDNWQDIELSIPSGAVRISGSIGGRSIREATIPSSESASLGRAKVILLELQP